MPPRTVATPEQVAEQLRREGRTVHNPGRRRSSAGRALAQHVDRLTSSILAGVARAAADRPRAKPYSEDG